METVELRSKTCRAADVRMAETPPKGLNCMMFKCGLTTSCKLCSTDRLMFDARVCKSLEGNPYWMMAMERGVILKWNAAPFTSCILQTKEMTNSSSRTPS